MTPTIAAAANLPKIVSPTNLGAISTVSGAHHWRLIGVEVTSSIDNTGLVRFGDPDPTVQNALSQVPHDLVVDRVVLARRDPTSQRGAAWRSTPRTSAVVDSYLSVVRGQRLRRAGDLGLQRPRSVQDREQLPGGIRRKRDVRRRRPGHPEARPADIEIRHNHFYKPVSWMAQWTVKNLFESKNAMRVLVEGNLFEDNWTDAQTGTAINIKAVNQDATAPWSGSTDVTFRNNIVQDVGGGLVIQAIDDTRGVGVLRTSRITIYNNIFQRLNTGQFTGPGNGFLLSGASFDASIYNNTVMTPDNAAVILSPDLYVHTRMSFRDNIVNGGNYGIKGDSYAGGTASIAHYTTASLFSANVFPIGYSVGYPVGNSYPVTIGAVGFVNPNGFDWHLSGSSPFVGQGSVQGTSPGADVDAVNTATANVIVP